MTDPYEVGTRLWTQWMEMWNGRPALARELVAERFVLHLPLPSIVDATTITHPAAVERWVSEHRARFEHLTFHVDAGPFIDTIANVVAGPWWAAVVANGTSRVVCGVDTIAFRDGRIVEYWTLAKDASSVGAWIMRIAP
jgi:hypothetical protein